MRALAFISGGLIVLLCAFALHGRGGGGAPFLAFPAALLFAEALHELDLARIRRRRRIARMLRAWPEDGVASIRRPPVPPPAPPGSTPPPRPSR